eukprot:16779_1
MKEYEMIELGCCGLKLHDNCLKHFVKSKDVSELRGQKITWKQLSCMICKKEMKCDKSKQLLNPINSLRAKIIEMGLNRLKYETRLNVNRQVTEQKSEFYQDPDGLAAKIYSFHICYKCSNPYFSGESYNSYCADVMEDTMKPEEYICLSCQPAIHTTNTLQMILRTMAGHGLWLCPNSHPYFIGNEKYPGKSWICYRCKKPIGNKVGYSCGTPAAGNCFVGVINKNGKISSCTLHVRGAQDLISMGETVLKYGYLDQLLGMLRFASTGKELKILTRENCRIAIKSLIFEPITHKEEEFNEIKLQQQEQIILINNLRNENNKLKETIEELRRSNIEMQKLAAVELSKGLILIQDIVHNFEILKMMFHHQAAKLVRKTLRQQDNRYSTMRNSKVASHLLFDILIETYNYVKNGHMSKILLQQNQAKKSKEIVNVCFNKHKLNMSICSNQREMMDCVLVYALECLSICGIMILSSPRISIEPLYFEPLPDEKIQYSSKIHVDAFGSETGCYLNFVIWPGIVRNDTNGRLSKQIAVFSNKIPEWNYEKLQKGTGNNDKTQNNSVD